MTNSDRSAIEQAKTQSPDQLGVRTGIVALTLCAAMIFAGVATAEDWPQWQGPDRNAISRERGLLQEWPKEGPRLAWKVTGIGTGQSTPSIAAGRIFGMSHRDGHEVVWALSEKDGSKVWETRLGTAYAQTGMEQANEGPGSTPTVDGDRLYVVGLGGEVSCVQVNDGKLLWQRSFTRDFGGSVPVWSFRESPLVDGDKVIVTPGGSEATMVALDKMTGKTIWKSVVPGSPGAAYSSAIAIDFEGRQYVQITAKALVGVAAADGKFLWRYDKPANPHGINISTPVHLDGKVFAASAYGTGGGLVKLSRDAAGAVKADEVYFTAKMQNHHGGMIVHDGALFGANGGNAGGYLISLNFQTGDVNWDERAGQRRVPKGSIAMADGRIYYRTEEGAMVLFEPSAKEYLERGRFDQPERSGKPAWAHPVIANGKLYLRDQDMLLSYDIARK
jgi:outer membrane protein assembly factor BamB